MATYDWKCHACGHKVEVERSMTDFKVGPDYACPECKGNEWLKTVSKSSVPFETLKNQGVFEF